MFIKKLRTGFTGQHKIAVNKKGTIVGNMYPQFLIPQFIKSLATLPAAGINTPKLCYIKKSVCYRQKENLRLAIQIVVSAYVTY
jgi:hypothetical protein